MFNDSYHFVRDFCRTNEVFRFTRTRYPRTLEQMTRCLFLSTHTVCVVGRSPTVSGFFLVLLTCVLGRLRIFRVFQRRLQPEGRDPVRTLQPASASFLALASSALRWLCSRCRCAISFQVDLFPTLVPGGSLSDTPYKQTDTRVYSGLGVPETPLPPLALAAPSPAPLSINTRLTDRFSKLISNAASRRQDGQLRVIVIGVHRTLSY